MDRTVLDASYRSWLGAQSAPAPPSTIAPLTVVALVDDASDPRSIVASVIGQPLAAGLWLVDVSSDRRYRDALRLMSPAVRTPVEDDGDAGWLPPDAGAHLILLPPGTQPTPDALATLAAALLRDSPDWLYTDDDRLLPDGRRGDPFLKGSFDATLALVDDCSTRLALVSRATAERAGGLRASSGAAQVYDLLLRVVAGGGHVGHLPHVCCHRLQPVPSALPAQHRTVASAHLASRNLNGSVVETPPGPHAPFALTRVSWSAAPPPGSITIVIPTRNQPALLERCIRSLQRTVDPRLATLLIVDDASDVPAARQLLQRLERERPLQCRLVEAEASRTQFNYARLMNDATRHVRTPLMLHLNDDVEALEAGWLEQMAGWLSDPTVGVVGARLLFPDGRLQHAGVQLIAGGTPEHLFTGLALEDPGYQWLAHRAREVSAVTGACLLTRTALFSEHRFEADHLAVQFNDVDYCLRLGVGGYRCIYEPAAVLRHVTSASRGRTHDHRENAFFLDRYGDRHDVYTSPHLDPLTVTGPSPRVRFGGC